MTTAHPPHQPTVRDFMRPIVAHRWVVLAVVLIAVGSSIAYSVNQTPSYSAEASLEFQSENRDLGLVGLPLSPTQTAGQLADASARTIIQRRVLSRVQRYLKTSMSVSQLADSVDAVVQPSSNLVLIETKARTARDAQRLANAFAREGAAVANAEARESFADAVRALRRHRPGSKKDPTVLAVYNEQLARLQALSAIASPAQVAEFAQRPTSPTSPRPLRNAMFGGFLGLLLGLLVAFVRDSFDRRLRSAGEIRNELGLPLLGHVRAEAMGQAPAPGGDTVTSTDWELFRILRVNLDFLDPDSPAKAIAVTSSLPAEGKTTVAACLAFASAAAGRRTLLMECDLRRPTLAERLGIESAPGITDFVNGSAEPGDILQAISFSDPASQNGSGPHVGVSDDFMHKLVCITAGTPTQHPVEVLRSDRFATMLDQVQDAYDVVILDTTPLLSVVDALELLPRVSTIVWCVRAFQATRDQVHAGKAALDRLPERPIGLVVTGTRHANETDYGYYGYYPMDSG